MPCLYTGGYRCRLCLCASFVKSSFLLILSEIRKGHVSIMYTRARVTHTWPPPPPRKRRIYRGGGHPSLSWDIVRGACTHHTYTHTLASAKTDPLAVWLMTTPSGPMVASVGIPRTPNRAANALRRGASENGIAAHGISPKYLRARAGHATVWCDMVRYGMVCDDRSIDAAEGIGCRQHEEEEEEVVVGRGRVHRPAWGV